MFYLQNHWVALHLWMRLLRAAYVGYLFLQNHRALLYLWVSSLNCSLLLLGLVTESLDHTRLIGAPPKVQPTFVSSKYRIYWVTLHLWVRYLNFSLLVTSSFRIAGLYITYGCPALNAAYDIKHYLQNHWRKLQVWVSNLTWSLCLLAVPSESLSYTTLISVQPQVKRMIVKSTYRITGLH